MNDNINIDSLIAGLVNAGLLTDKDLAKKIESII